LLAKKAVSCFSPGDQGGTFCGNPLCCAAGVAAVGSLLADGFLEQTRAIGFALANGLRKLSQELGLGEVRGQGLLLALELGADVAPQIVEKARDSGLLINAPRPHNLRFMPALNSSASEVEEGLSRLKELLRW
jgi:acetylornithine/N-succinyldiaminopimelate aminotransferase